MPRPSRLAGFASLAAPAGTLAALGVLAAIGCRDGAGPGGAGEADGGECARACHGGGEGPFFDRAGATDPSARGVGAHEAHRDAPATGVPVGCWSCHARVETVEAEGHIDAPEARGTPADVVFAEGSSRGGDAAWDPERLTCANLRCHAGFGAEHPEPVWTRVDGTQAACGSCHGVPPPPPAHPEASDCALCHPGPDAATHLDGTLQVETLPGCGDCHGRDGDGAPPPALDGATDTAARGVGAHLAHLAPSGPSRPVACEACHLVPAGALSAGHMDTDPPAEVTFAADLVSGATAPAWDGGTLACGDVACHARSGAAHPEPVWTRVDGTQATCGSCHGMPPPPPHPADWGAGCDLCHPTAAAAGIAEPERHVDGVVDVLDLAAMACDACHGGAGSSWPPAALDGATETSARGVGAHRAHSAARVPCAECHAEPATVTAAGHMDDGPPAEVVFGPVARAGGLAPAWSDLRCADTWCHGGGVSGGEHGEPLWTQVDGTQAGCGSCHGNPPPSPHPARADCSTCHGAGGPDDPDNHVNGRVDF